jgi:hypothetical protein
LSRTKAARFRQAAGWRNQELQKMTDDELLELRLRDLPLVIEGTPLEERLARLNEELRARRLKFRPHVWLSEEWFSPDGVPGFAIPFYLAHPRLMKLENRQMFEVEGASDVECLRIMRHETGHAIDNAFGLRYKRRHRQLFGPFNLPYPDTYRPKPASRDYVLHLNAWYAQAHPAEDFAETFAVWLARPAPRWRRLYANWPLALSKLEYVNRVMEGLKGVAPPNRRRTRVDPLRRLKSTLLEHYQRKRQHYLLRGPANYDKDLRSIFTAERSAAGRLSAASFLRRYRRELCHAVAEGTGVHHYAVDQIYGFMIGRAKEMKLRLADSPEQTRRQVLVMLTVQTMNGLHQGYHRIAL